MAYEFMATVAKYKPHFTMVVSQIFYAILYFVTEAAFNEGLNPHVYVTFRFILAGLFMLPFAYFLEGNALTMNMYFLSMENTSPTFVASIFNSVSSLTFVLAVILRMEVVDVKNPRGFAKVLGTLISLAGVTAITLYKGPALQSLWDAPIHITKRFVHENWVKGSILTVASCISWAMWYIMQANALKNYPAKFSLTTWMNLLGGATSAVFTVCLQHKSSAWSIKTFSVSFWAVIYSGLCSSVLVFLQFWCMKDKGPVFAAMFNPLQTVIVVILAYFVLGEKLYTGSILGGAIVIIGLYLLLWGKERDRSYIQSQEQSSSDPEDQLKPAKDEEVASVAKEEP
ncbi:Drug/metabolite transporter [Corchorus olitorius]|uniref:WAT1-related protein n=1 Tax=Corchorus olitorius TaxID=93759 RepID=A0A1R3GAL7_9ROSI|nr:Drug/metabolite transporter [Corchorus olitorius]